MSSHRSGLGLDMIQHLRELPSPAGQAIQWLCSVVHDDEVVVVDGQWGGHDGLETDQMKSVIRQPHGGLITVMGRVVRGFQFVVKCSPSGCLTGLPPGSSIPQYTVRERTS